MNQVNAVFRHAGRFVHAIIVDRSVMPSGKFLTVDSKSAACPRPDRIGGKSILPDDLRHRFQQFIMPFPLLQKYIFNLILAVRIDDVNVDLAHLQKAVDSVDCLNKIVKLVIDADENCVGAMPLKVASGAGKFGLRGKVFDLPIGEINHRLFPCFDVLLSPDCNRFRQCLLNGFPFIL